MFSLTKLLYLAVSCCSSRDTDVVLTMSVLRRILHAVTCQECTASIVQSSHLPSNISLHWQHLGEYCTVIRYTTDVTTILYEKKT